MRKFNGDGKNITQNNATVNGDQNTVTGQNLKINGDYNKVMGNNPVINGDFNTITGNNSIINGDQNVIIGNNGVLNGDQNVVTGNNWTDNGDGNVINGQTKTQRKTKSKSSSTFYGSTMTTRGSGNTSLVISGSGVTLGSIKNTNSVFGSSTMVIGGNISLSSGNGRVRYQERGTIVTKPMQVSLNSNDSWDALARRAEEVARSGYNSMKGEIESIQIYYEKEDPQSVLTKFPSSGPMTKEQLQGLMRMGMGGGKNVVVEFTNVQTSISAHFGDESRLVKPSEYKIIMWLPSFNRRLFERTEGEQLGPTIERITLSEKSNYSEIYQAVRRAVLAHLPGAEIGGMYLRPNDGYEDARIYFPKEGLIDPNLLRYLQTLNNEIFADVFITNVPELEPEPYYYEDEDWGEGEFMYEDARSRIGCNVCGKQANLTCAKCQKPRYCSSKCQYQDYGTHQFVCFKN